MPAVPAHLQRSRMKVNVVELAERKKDTSFKELVWNKLGDDHKQWTVLHNEILVATYVKPRVTMGGIIIPEASVDEDRYQGKVGLVIALGEGAFNWPAPYKYVGTKPKVGDFVVFHSSDTREIGYKGLSIKRVNDQLVCMIIPEADADEIY